MLKLKPPAAGFAAVSAGFGRLKPNPPGAGVVEVLAVPDGPESSAGFAPKRLPPPKRLPEVPAAGALVLLGSAAAVPPPNNGGGGLAVLAAAAD